MSRLLLWIESPINTAPIGFLIWHRATEEGKRSVEEKLDAAVIVSNGLPEWLVNLIPNP